MGTEGTDAAVLLATEIHTELGVTNWDLLREGFENFLFCHLFFFLVENAFLSV